MILSLFALFFLKHFIVDFPLQPRWMYANKHILGHPGGIAHSGLHAIVSLVILLFWLPFAPAFVAALAEFLIHYFTDLGKMRLNARLGWGPATCEQFWWLLGADQYVHYMTYWGIVAFAVGVAP